MSLMWPARNWERKKKPIWDNYFEIGEGDKRCDPVTGNVEFDGDDSTIIEGIVDGVARDNSSALVPDPKRYSFPRHLTVDEPVKALK